MYRNEPVIIKQSPVVIVKDFLAIQFAAVAAFFFSRVLADYGELYEKFFLSQSVSYHLAEAAAIFIFEVALVFFTFLQWYKEYYEISQDKMVHGRGIIFRHREIVSLRLITSISYSQGPLGKRTKYGNIEMLDSSMGRRMKFYNIPEPQKFIDMLIKLKEDLSVKDHVHGKVEVRDLVGQDEHEGLEFKSSFRWDRIQNKLNKNLEKAVMKTVAAFMNSNGGHVIIGVDDQKRVIGISEDFSSLPKANADGFKNHFTNVFHQMIGPEFRQFVKLSCVPVEGKEVCWVQVVPSTRPVYMKVDEKEEFYIRTGNGTTPLKLSEASSYIDSKWSNARFS